MIPPLTNLRKMRTLRARLAASAAVAPDVRRPLFGPAPYLFAAFLSVSLAAITAAHEAHGLGWPLVEVGALFSLAAIGALALAIIDFHSYFVRSSDV